MYLLQFMLLLNPGEFSKEVIEDCYTTDTKVQVIATMQKMEFEVVLVPTNNAACNKFPHGVLVTLKGNALRDNQTVYLRNFSYEQTRKIAIKCLNCMSLPQVSMVTVQIESQISKTIVPVGQVILMLMDARDCVIESLSSKVFDIQDIYYIKLRVNNLCTDFIVVDEFDPDNPEFNTQVDSSKISCRFQDEKYNFEDNTPPKIEMVVDSDFNVETYIVAKLSKENAAQFVRQNSINCQVEVVFRFYVSQFRITHETEAPGKVEFQAIYNDTWYQLSNESFTVTSNVDGRMTDLLQKAKQFETDVKFRADSVLHQVHLKIGADKYMFENMLPISKFYVHDINIQYSITCQTAECFEQLKRAKTTNETVSASFFQMFLKNNQAITALGMYPTYFVPSRIENLTADIQKTDVLIEFDLKIVLDNFLQVKLDFDIAISDLNTGKELLTQRFTHQIYSTHQKIIIANASFLPGQQLLILIAFGTSGHLIDQNYIEIYTNEFPNSAANLIMLGIVIIVLTILGLIVLSVPMCKGKCCKRKASIAVKTLDNQAGMIDDDFD